MWKKVEIACKLYSWDKLHLSHSTALCDGRLVVNSIYSGFMHLQKLTIIHRSGGE